MIYSIYLPVDKYDQFENTIDFFNAREFFIDRLQTHNSIGGSNFIFGTILHIKIKASILQIALIVVQDRCKLI